jgi:hypothetical protein
MSSQSVLAAVEQLSFDFLPQLPIVVQQHEGQLSSDAGLLPLRQFDQRWRYTQRLAQCLLVDPRSAGAGERRHSLASMLRQRLFGILAGYEDCNDHDTLRDDPIFKLIAADRRPDDADEGDDKPLASQPTLCRFENLPTPKVLQAMIDFLIDTGIERLKQHHGGGTLPPSITLDLDATDDPTHGQQQLTLFHGYFGQYQYFPLIISEPTTKHVFVAWLRPGTVHAALGAEEDLMRVVNALRKARPDIAIHVRGDAGFGVPWMYQVCEENHLTYTFGFSTNERLKKLTEPLMTVAVAQYGQTNEKQRLFDCFDYQAEAWDQPRRLIAKAECHSAGTNLRFVITNRTDVAAGSSEDGQRAYDHYVQRGESEQRMDELKNGLSTDRLSCHRFMANFFRLLLHAAAFNLLNAVRDHADLPEVMRVGQPCTWRTRLIKVAAVVVRRTRRIIVQLAANWPWWTTYQAVARRSLNFSCGP